MLVPLLMEQGYRPKGWLVRPSAVVQIAARSQNQMSAQGLILGTRLWYPFYGCDDEDDTAFQRRLDPVVGEIGDRGKILVPEAVPPRKAAAPKASTAPAPETPPPP
eukprot:COSAG03_NODE_7757_length_876_cov_1.335907_1_plen_105_part_10